MIDKAALKQVLENQIANPGSTTEFLRQLRQLVVENHSNLDLTLDPELEINRILTTLYTEMVHCDLILQLIPELAGRTVDPNATAFISSRTPSTISSRPDDAHSRLTLGTTISRPLHLERIGDKSIHYPNTMSNETLDLGEAWLASDDILQRQILLRELESSTDIKSQEVKQFIREAQIAGQLEHPNILPVYSLAWSVDNKPYYTMKLVDGISLQQHIGEFHENRQSLTRSALRDSLDILLAVCNAISYAHARGVFHSQINAASVSIGEFGEVMVLNWSNAGVTEDENVSEKLAIDDCRAIGALLFEILTGAPPRDHSLSGLSSLSSAVPASLASILKKAFLDDGCYTSVASLADDVRSYLADQPTIAHKDSIYESLSRWSRHHPMHILFGSVTLLLLVFTLMTETFILRSATDEAQETLAGIRHITRHLYHDNQQIDKERQEQEQATNTSIKALDQAQQLLITAERNAKLALIERDTARKLQQESKLLDENAQIDYRRALEQDEIALELLAQAQADERRATDAAEQIRRTSLTTFRSQIERHIIEGRNDLALDNARSLVQFAKDSDDSTILESPLLRAIANHSYIRTSQTDLNKDLSADRAEQQSANNDSLLVITQILSDDKGTLVHMITQDKQLQQAVPGRVEFLLASDIHVVAISNAVDESVVTILGGKTPVFGRLSGKCTTAVLLNQTLYAGLSSGRIVKYSLEELSESAPLTTLPDAPTRIAISPDGAMLAISVDTTLQILDLQSKRLRYTFPLPSECRQLWFASDNSVALLTDQSYINEFVFRESNARRIRFRPSSDDNQLVDFAEYGNSHYLLFAKGTLVKLDSQLNPRIRRLDDAIHSRILEVNQTTLQVLNRDGRLYEIAAGNLLNNGTPLSPSSSVVAATSDGESKLVVLANGMLETYLKPSINKAESFNIGKDLKNLGFTINGNMVAQKGKHQVIRILPNGEHTTLYEHSAPILSLRSLGNGRFLGVEDSERITILPIGADGQLLTSYIFPTDVNLDTFCYSAQSDSAYVCSSTTLYHFKEEQTYTSSHPNDLNGLLKTTLSRDARHLLLTSSQVSSKAFSVDLETLKYSRPYEFEGFVRETFWNTSSNRFQLIITKRTRPKEHVIISLEADGADINATLSLPIKSASLRSDANEMVILTDNNRLIIYSLTDQEIVRHRHFNSLIRDLQIVDKSRHLLITFRDSSIILGIDSLKPTTPLLEGNYLAPIRLGNQFYMPMRTAHGVLLSSMPALLGATLTPEQARTFYQQ